jgi:hypothetical protein
MRLALREEGLCWNAYAAPIGTMEGAKLIGHVPVAAARANPEVRAEFLRLMQLVVETMLEGKVTGWGTPSQAPERERAGHG